MGPGKKKNALLYLDEDLIKEVKDLGLNLSKICENALKEAINRLKSENNPNSAFNEGRGWDSNPGSRLHRPEG